MDFIDRMLLRVLAWPGAKRYWTCSEMRERLRDITGERTVIHDQFARLERLRDLGHVQRREKGRGQSTFWNITDTGKEQLKCRREKAG
jgi:hypothetical protein